MSTPSITDICRLNDFSYVLTGLDAGGALNMKISSSLRSGCADTTIALDTIAPYVLNIRDTAGYYAGPKAFSTINLNISVNNFNPVIQEHCQNVDTVLLSSSIPDSVCGGDAVVLSSINSSVSWYSDGCGNNLIGTGNSVSVFPTSDQTYYARMEGCDTSACKPITVNVKVKPDASFNASYFVTCNGVRADITNQSVNADSYIWNFSDGSSSTESEPSHTFAVNSIPSVYLIATNSNSCSDTTLVDSTFAHNLPDFFDLMLPNVFTPNNDGINDKYGLTLKSDMPDCFSLKIFDRWGIKMFDSQVSGTSWDGRTSSGIKAVPGVYFCILKINDYEFTGEINLLE
jgi:gliding motility-associated-like protein